MLAGLLARRLAIPDVVVYLLVGMLLGPGVSGAIDIKADSALNQIILIFGACYILFDGGASLRVAVLKQVWITIVVIATVGVVITAAITAAAASWILGIPLAVAALLGAAIASTDPATLVPVFRQVRIRERVAQTVMSESALNDATGAILTFAVLALASGAEFSVGAALVDLCKQALFGLLVGGVLGYLAALFIAHERLAFLAEYAPLVTLMTVIGAYLGADNLQASGFMAVFTFGVVLGKKDALGFAMGAREQERLDEVVPPPPPLIRKFIFILLGAPVGFPLIKPLLGGGAPAVELRMPLHRAHVARPARAHGFNQSIGHRARFDPQIAPQALDRLVMDRHHAPRAAFAIEARKPGARLEAHLVRVLVIVVAAMRRHVLVQRAAERDVDELRAAADAEHRLARFR